MLILAGVALRDAGVLVRLLLLGVMPFRGGSVGHLTTIYFNSCNIYSDNRCNASIPGTGSW